MESRAFSNVGPGMTYATSSPSATSAGQGNNPPVCQNCTTSTTPLWRRDEIGSVLCNACGLFLKLHGKPRPISLKTDVIKSRNRVKSAGQGPKKKSLFDSNGLSSSRSDAGTPPPSHFIHRRTSGKTSSGASNRSDSPVSRTATPGIHHGSHLAAGVFDGNSLSEHGFHPSPSFPGLHLSHPSPGSTSSYNERHLEPPQSYEALQAANTALKTRVSELEIINDLFKGRVSQLEQSESSTRHSDMAHRDGEDQLRQALEESQRRERDLKRRVEELERDVTDLRDAAGPRPKKMRVSDIVDDDRVLSTTPMSGTS